MDPDFGNDEFFDGMDKQTARESASYEPVRQAVLDTDPDSAAADESFFWIQIPILLLLMKVFYNEAKRGKIGH
jgi:hypothetical protein